MKYYGNGDMIAVVVSSMISSITMCILTQTSLEYVIIMFLMGYVVLGIGISYMGKKR